MSRTPSLSEAQATLVKVDIAAGMKQTDVAEKHGISRSLVSDIACGRRYVAIPWPDGQPPAPNPTGGQHKPTEDYDPTDKKIRELEAEVIHLTEERNRARTVAKSNAKTEGLFKAMADELPGAVVPFERLPKARQTFKPKANRIEEHAVLHLSDGHHDQVVVPEECGGLETYDFPISCCRAERLVDSTLQWTQQTLGDRFYFPVLNVLAYGDHTSGEIHGAATRSYFRFMMRNCLAIGKLHAMMYRDLAQFFEQVNVVYVPGNHGRRTQKKDYHGAHDNWDYLLAVFAREACRDIDNISFLIPNSFSVNLDINGVGFNIAHGDDVRSSLGIPWYGLQKRQSRLQALAPLMKGPRVRYYCVGHFHQKGMVGAQDTETIMNGPWPATDAYAFNSLARPQLANGHEVEGCCP
jgi:UDP-2,3-diacylglucosamine pyrophosphatase LpxH